MMQISEVLDFCNQPNIANLGSSRLWKKTRINLMIAIWEYLSLWNKHDDDDDAIWEFKIVEETGINMMMEFGS